MYFGPGIHVALPQILHDMQEVCHHTLINLLVLLCILTNRFSGLSFNKIQYISALVTVEISFAMEVEWSAEFSLTDSTSYQSFTATLISKVSFNPVATGHTLLCLKISTCYTGGTSSTKLSVPDVKIC